MSIEDNPVRRNLKFKITTRGIRDSEVKSCENPSKRKAEVSLDDETGKRKKMDTNFKLLCGIILKDLCNHPAGWIFSEPVDPVKLKIPDYFSIIARPMDLGTIKRKLEGNMYSGAGQFAADVRLTFSNAMLYNPPGHEVHSWAKKLDGEFSRRWKLLEAKLKHGNKTVEEASFVKKDGQDIKQAVERSHQGMKPIGLDKPPLRVQLGTCKPMPSEEKQKFRLELLKVLSRNVTGSMQTLFKKFGLTVPNKERLDAYINSTDDETLWKLRREINVFLTARDRKIEPAKIAQNRRPLLRKTVPKEHCTQGAGASANRRQSVGSTQAPTSDISSERSSEHDHSGDSILDCKVKCSSAVRATSLGLDSDGPGVVLNEENNCRLSTPASTSAFAEGQLSPKRALRAAMLKSRFADTIYKATHQVLLDKGDKSIRLTMQQERENMEREQLKERARIQAEIKASKSGEEDDLKLRRARERAALEKMEKTVDICETAAILKDVELLYYASLAAPLENLGLYMKYGDFEDEEDTNLYDAEEGEIL